MDRVLSPLFCCRSRRQSSIPIGRARSMFRRGRYDEAVAYLREKTDAHGVTEAVEADRLEALRNRIVAGDQMRRQRVLELLRSGTAKADGGDLGAALSDVREAVRCDPSDLDASALLDDLLDRDLQTRIEGERRRALETSPDWQGRWRRRWRRPRSNACQTGWEFSWVHPSLFCPPVVSGLGG